MEVPMLASPTCYFHLVPNGHAFMWDGNIYVKLTDPVVRGEGKTTHTTVQLNDDVRTTFFQADTEVTLLTCKGFNITSE